MIRLALDTSTRLGSVALADGERILAESTLPARAARSETVLPEVERLLRLGGRRSEDLGSIVVGSGPGSFTGVRIAAALAKGLCFGGGLPLFAYSSLLAVAAGSGLEGNVCAAFDARRDEVYGAAYRRVAPPQAEIEPAALPLGELLARVQVSEWTFAGDGALKHRDVIERHGGRVLPAPFAAPRAAALLWLAWACPEAGRVGRPADWEPEYVRRSGALRALERAG